MKSDGSIAGQRPAANHHSIPYIPFIHAIYQTRHSYPYTVIPAQAGIPIPSILSIGVVTPIPSEIRCCAGRQSPVV